MIADIPGLVEGAAEGRGLGHEFLRHVERARVLLVLVDLARHAAGCRPPSRSRCCWTSSAGTSPTCSSGPALVVGSKADLVADRDRRRHHSTSPSRRPPAQGWPRCTGRLAELVAAARAELEAVRPAVVIHRPLGEQIAAERVGPGIFELVGRAAERAVALSDLNDDQALDVVLGRLRRLGVDRVLARAGARDGDEVGWASSPSPGTATGPDSSLEPEPRRGRRDGDARGRS